MKFFFLVFQYYKNHRRTNVSKARNCWRLGKISNEPEIVKIPMAVKSNCAGRVVVRTGKENVDCGSVKTGFSSPINDEN